MLQMELMSVPILTLSFGAIFLKQIKEKRFNHVPFFLLLIFFISNFILFDLRHDSLLTQKFLLFLSPKGGPIHGYYDFLMNRIDLAFQGTEILRRNVGASNLALFLITIALIFVQIRNKKYKLIYLSFLYFYFGYYVLSLINKGQVLYFHQFPIFPLVFLVFSSLTSSKFAKPFLLLFFAVLALNIRAAFLDIKESKSFIGESKYSWKFLNEASQKAFKGSEKELGYFVYAPDVLAYEPKYAMIYNAEKSGKKTFYFQKMPVTYLFIQPPPPNDPYMTENFWINTQVGIKSSPSAEIKFPNGYKLQKYNLTEEEIKIPFDPAIDPGLHFR